MPGSSPAIASWPSTTRPSRRGSSSRGPSSAPRGADPGTRGPPARRLRDRGAHATSAAPAPPRARATGRAAAAHHADGLRLLQRHSPPRAGLIPTGDHRSRPLTVLGLDTATWTAAVGLVRDGAVLAEAVQQESRSHAQSLPLLVERALAHAGLGIQVAVSS